MTEIGKKIRPSTMADRRAAGGNTERYTAYRSQDGTTWVRGGVWTHHLGTDARIGLVSMGATTR